MATSTTGLEDMLNKLSQQVDARIQEILSQSLSRLEDRLKAAIESFHETIACSIVTKAKWRPAPSG